MSIQCTKLLKQVLFFILLHRFIFMFWQVCVKCKHCVHIQGKWLVVTKKWCEVAADEWRPLTHWQMRWENPGMTATGYQFSVPTMSWITSPSAQIHSTTAHVITRSLRCSVSILTICSKSWQLESLGTILCACHDHVGRWKYLLDSTAVFMLPFYYVFI